MFPERHSRQTLHRGFISELLYFYIYKFIYLCISNSAHLQLSNKNCHICQGLCKGTNLLCHLKTISLIHDRQESFIKPNQTKQQPCLRSSHPRFGKTGQLFHGLATRPIGHLFKNSNLQNVGALGVLVFWGQGQKSFWCLKLLLSSELKFASQIYILLYSAPT